ncbi:MAG: hypothetical protein LBS36_13520 [Oscillospiraceae bacterium]|jgi:hypothetical protein|nr:hypothetical protein [Oscillospiraceae bacterium]
MKGSGSIDIAVKGLKDLKKQLDKMDAQSQTVIKRTVSDFKSRAPAWVSAAVVSRYGINKTEISNSKKKTKKIVSIKATGTTVDNAALVYQGRPLTPTHFKMRPTTRPKSTKDENGKTIRRARPYTVTAEVLKGQREALGPKVFLGSTRKGKEIPFQRVGKERKPIEAVKRLAVPQMIEYEQVTQKIREDIDKNLGERFRGHLKRELSKK